MSNMRTVNKVFVNDELVQNLVFSRLSILDEVINLSEFNLFQSLLNFLDFLLVWIVQNVDFHPILPAKIVYKALWVSCINFFKKCD